MSEIARSKALVGGSIAMLLALGVAACGSADDEGQASSAGSSDAVAEAQKVVDAALEPATTWPGPDEPVTPPSGRKRIAVIYCGATGVACKVSADGVVAAGETLGWSVSAIDGQQQPTVQNQAIRSAVAQNVDGIVLSAVPPATVAGALAAAKKAGIPVVAILNKPSDAANVDYQIDFDRFGAGALAGSWVVAASGGTATTLNVAEPAYVEVTEYFDGVKSVLEKCTGCTQAGTNKFTIALASQRVASGVTASLRSNPKIDYVMSPFDSVVPFITQGVRQAGKAGSVKVVSEGASGAEVDALADGSLAATVGVPVKWLGWQGMDALVRVMADAPLPDTYPSPPLRLFESPDAPEPPAWSGDVDCAAKYAELWGKG